MFPIDSGELQRALDALQSIRDGGPYVVTASHARVLCAVILRQEMRIRELEEKVRRGVDDAMIREGGDRG
jgi:hypothetical protein